MREREGERQWNGVLRVVGEAARRGVAVAAARRVTMIEGGHFSLSLLTTGRSGISPSHPLSFLPSFPVRPLPHHEILHDYLLHSPKPPSSSERARAVAA